MIYQKEELHGGINKNCFKIEKFSVDFDCMR